MKITDTRIQELIDFIKDPASSEAVLILKELQTLRAENKRVIKLFESLTPSGSEFVGDIDACYSFVKDRLHTVMEVAKERNELRDEVKEYKTLIQDTLDVLNGKVFTQENNNAVVARLEKVVKGA